MSAIQHQSSAEYTKLKGPGKYHVIMLNDNVTPMDFVVQILMVVFNKDIETAKSIVLEVHEKGRSIAGTYSYEVAEQKSLETISEAKRAGYPLDVILEEE
jgi:ATP-dependent Clp protease adaptor protein ClpS